MGHNVEHCVADNTGVVEVGDDLLSCGACLYPGDPADATIVGFILECLWCIYEMEVNACLIGYCQDKEGGSSGEYFCEAASYVADTPLWLLPIGNEGLQLTAMAIEYGCNSDEATDCTSPLIP